ncbi:MAG: glycosyltransferase [Chryseobacterium sp.]|jgi:glycosyltransferase involved in cell wall biosynthesis|uniref:glycosyltransferase family 2 protein n=1 Tax=Chryseobacterium sp. TaxID=1871047 RepID=UPI002631215A|nr:glycosyltransferase family A protein [Chryseobacterium sp.]MDF2552044.1 glycosyltransferase [Chryseobacterium sp.]MDF2933123.1 glycosyltransferase [Chryseobacterium sp.]
MPQPFVSVIVPCYNQAQYLDECLQSVFDQTYLNWECIIVNDGSPDNTREIATAWTKKDPRFIYFEKENGGVSSARNFGIERAKGEWILPLDGDDKIDKDYISLASQEFRNNPHVIYCRAEYFGAKSGEMVLDQFHHADILLENSIFCTSFYKRTSWEKIKGYDENMVNGYEDWEFWIHLNIFYGKLQVTKLDFIGFQYRIKELSRNTEAMQHHDENIRYYIYDKHSKAYRDNILRFYEHFATARALKKDRIRLLDKLNSKRYRVIDKVLNFFNK